MAGLAGLWNRLRTRTRHKGRRRVRPSGLSYERYGIDLLEKRRMLAFTPASDFTYTTANNQVAITAYVGSASAVEIPATINSLPVTSIGDSAFLYRTSLASVVIPSSVASIGEAAFYYCTSLTGVTMSPGVTSIGKDAFSYCTSLASVAIPSSVASIGETAFYYCTSLTGVTISPGVTSIGKDAFSYCDSLVNLFLPSTVQYLGEYAFDSSSLQGVYFYGDAPEVDPGASLGGNGVTMYHLPGTSGWTRQYNGATTAVFPSTMAPTSVAGIRGNGQVQLSWTAPVYDGGLSVTDYTIQYSSNSGSSWQTFTDAASSATSATVTGLTNGTGYLFRVASVNAVGAGSFAATSSSITPNAVPLPPTNIVATRGRGVVTVSWTTPVSTAGVRITDYRVQQSTNGGISWVTVGDGVSTSTRTVVSGLVMGRDYIFRVAAVGRSGAGDFSSPSAIVTPATVPAAPVGVLAIGGLGQVVVSWRAPASSGGSPISQYIVQYSPSAGRWITSTTVGSNTTTATVSGLLANRPYSFRVLAVNDMGNSPASRVVIARTLRPAVVRV